MPILRRSNERLVYSTRWFDPEANQSDRPAKPPIALEIVITDERLEALAQRTTLSTFLKGEVRSHVAA
jgi:hypothetical protein